MVNSKVSPLPFNVPIADPNTGNPSPFFARQLGQLLDEAIATAVATAAAAAAAAAAQATADAAVPQTRLINTAAPITGGGDLTTDLNLGHAASGVAAGSYTSANITVDADGHVTAAANGTGGGGTGTVTSVSVTTANGVSGSVATATTTPAITITLGAITPSSVNASGNVTGANLSGTNTGDQTTVSGNAGSATILQTARNFSITGGGITAAAVSFNGSAVVTLSASVDAGHITLARMASVATGTIFYRKTAGTGDPEVQTLATLKTDLAISAGDISGLGYFATGTDAANLTGTVAAGRFPAMTGGDVTSSAGTVNLTIGANVVTYAKFQQVAASSLVGNATGSLANATGITLGTGLDFSGSTLRGAVVHPGYVSGNWYSTSLSAASAVGTAIPANSIRLMPFTISKSITISALGVRITTLSASGNVQIAIYANNAATGRPTGSALCSTASITTGSTGAVSASASVTLAPGTYWMAINQDNAVAAYTTLALTSSTTAYLIGSATLANIISNSSTQYLMLTTAQTFGTWPDLTSASFAETATQTSALVFMKAA